MRQQRRARERRARRRGAEGIPADHVEVLRLADRAAEAVERCIARGSAPESLSAAIVVLAGRATIVAGPTSTLPHEPTFEELRALEPVRGATWCLVVREGATPYVVLLLRRGVTAPGGRA